MNGNHNHQHPPELLKEIESLRTRLEEAEEVIRAIQSGEVDALAVQGPDGPRVFTLQGANLTYRTLIEEMNEGVVTLDRNGLILYSNACFANLLHLGLEEVIGSSFYNFVPKDFRAYIEELFRKGWEGRSKGEIPLQGKKGMFVPFSLSASLLQVDEVLTLGLIVTDLSAQREIQHIKGLVDIQNTIIDKKNEELRRQEAARKEADQVRVVLEGIPQMTWTNLPSGEINFYNQRWYDYTGLTFEQTRDWGWQPVVHPDDLPLTMERYLRALSTGEVFTVQNRYRCRTDGIYRWHLNRALPLRDAEGNITLWVGTATDIHDRMIAEEANADLLAKVEEQRRTLYHLFAQMPAPINVLRGPNLIFELANETYQRIAGNRSLLGKPLMEALPGLDPSLLAIHQQVYQTGESYIGQSVPIALDWELTGKPYPKYFDFMFEPLRDEQGNVEGLISFGYEVTAQVLARKAIEENADKVRTILESLPQIAWTANTSGMNTYLNQKWYDYTGDQGLETKIFSVAPYLHPDDRELTDKKWSHSVRTGEAFDIEYRIRNAEREYHWMLGRGLPVRNEQGEITLWVGTCTDIHEQKLMMEELALAQQQLSTKNEELIRSNVDLDNFVYTASHDLKSPVTTLDGLINLLSKRLANKLDERESKMMEMARGSTSKLLRTIRDLTEIIKLQKDSDLEKEPITFRELLDDVLSDLSAILAASKAHLTTDFEAESITYARKNLRSILYNLLSNALKYHSPERQPNVHVATRAVGKTILLTVTDNGLGFKPEQLQKLFTMFRRFHTHVEGTGIGLYMIKRIVENNGGKIEVDSQEGKGSTFRVYF